MQNYRGITAALIDKLHILQLQPRFRGGILWVSVSILNTCMLSTLTSPDHRHRCFSALVVWSKMSYTDVDNHHRPFCNYFHPASTFLKLSQKRQFFFTSSYTVSSVLGDYCCQNIICVGDLTQLLRL